MVNITAALWTADSEIPRVVKVNAWQPRSFSGHLGVDDWPPSSQSIDLPKGQASLCTVDTESISRAQTCVSSVAGLCDVSNTYLITGLTRLTQYSGETEQRAGSRP